MGLQGRQENEYKILRHQIKLNNIVGNFINQITL